MHAGPPVVCEKRLATLPYDIPSWRTAGRRAMTQRAVASVRYSTISASKRNCSLTISSCFTTTPNSLNGDRRHPRYSITTVSIFCALPTARDFLGRQRNFTAATGYGTNVIPSALAVGGRRRIPAETRPPADYKQFHVWYIRNFLKSRNLPR
jgi:hypothetical protein